MPTINLMVRERMVGIDELDFLRIDVAKVEVYFKQLIF